MDKNRICMRVDLDALAGNIALIRERIANRRLWAVIKCDAYGHGAVPIARFLEREELVFGFALATSQEAFELRDSGIKSPLLVLGCSDVSDYPRMIGQEIRATLFTEEAARAFSDAACRVGRKGLYHIKVDTGMSRIGLFADGEGEERIRRMAGFPMIACEGIFTHLATADEADKSRAEGQLQTFSAFAERLRSENLCPPCLHAANSAAILEMPDALLTDVRAGIILYGIAPSEEMRPVLLRPVMSLHSTVVYVKTIPQGTAVGYGAAWTAPREARIATIPVGYGDGWPRSLSGKGCVLINGHRAPITGRICMDQLMADVTEIPDVTHGTPVTLLGSSGDCTVTMEELGALSGRFPYEFACCLGQKRIPRIYTRGGKTIEVSERF